MRKDENLIQKQPAEIYNRKGVPKNLGKFTGNHLCQGLFLSKVTDLNLHLYLKNRPWPKCFPPHFANFLRVSSFTEHPLHKKWSFPLRISSVNVTKSAGNCAFGHVYWRNPYWKTSFFVQWPLGDCFCSSFINNGSFIFKGVIDMSRGSGNEVFVFKVRESTDNIVLCFRMSQQQGRHYWCNREV